MKQPTPTEMNDAVLIADRTWWVGHHLPGDPFQCHVYLIENGDQSVLIDPGSLLTFDHTRRKIEQVVPLEAIRYYVCHHQDPDVAGAMHRIDALVTRPDAVLVTHWRARALLRHMALEMPMWLVDEHEWTLDLEDRTLRFVFTPYMHFPGAYVTFDTKTGVLFSSDIFGGFTDTQELWAKDESVFEEIRPFHEHYMPSNEVVLHGMRRLEKLPIHAIAPQHGKLIPKPLVSFVIERLKTLDCGLYLMSVHDTDIARLLGLSRVLREALKLLVLHRDFSGVATGLTEVIGRVLPVVGVEAWVAGADLGLLTLQPETSYRGVPSNAGPELLAILERSDGPLPSPQLVEAPGDRDAPWRLLLPLHVGGSDAGGGTCAALRLSERVVLDDDVLAALEQIREPLAVAIERELVLRRLEVERLEAHERSLRDPMTNLYNRAYMVTTVRRLMEIHDRDHAAALSMVVMDVDYFKRVNDTHGHMVGDEVLRGVAGALRSACRTADIAVRLGGEEFGIFVAGEPRSAFRAAERVRTTVEALSFEGEASAFAITISGGVAGRRPGETLEEWVGRADKALYRAKQAGRNRVFMAEEPEL